MKRLVFLAALAACGDNEVCDPAGEMCRKLSYYEFFDDIASQQPAAGVTPYTIETPLFSDYTTKRRFFVLPPGTSATWSDRDAFELPTGSVLVKTFAYGERKLETRLLIRGSEGWH
ncbi:MAG: hypothetical protein ABI678_24620, partial [Kofleriaceae bacterium]